MASLGKEIFNLMLDSNLEGSLSRQMENHRHALKRISVKLAKMRKAGISESAPEYRKALAQRANAKLALQNLKKQAAKHKLGD